MTVGTVRAGVGSRIVGAGLALVAVAVIGYTADHRLPEAAAPPRSPWAPSAPPTAPPTKPTRPSHMPRSGPRHTPAVPRAVPAAEHGTGGGTPPRRPRPTTPSRPAPSPPASSPPAAASCDVGVTVLVLKACLRLGETR